MLLTALVITGIIIVVAGITLILTEAALFRKVD